MAFESLSEKLNAAFKKLRGKGRLSEADVKDAMREVRMALLEADVSYKVVKDFVKARHGDAATGADVLEAPDPGADDRQDRQRGAVRADGRQNQQAQHLPEAADASSCSSACRARARPPTAAKLAGLHEEAGQAPAARRLRHLPSRRHQAAGGRSASSWAFPVFQMGHDRTPCR